MVLLAEDYVDPNRRKRDGVSHNLVSCLCITEDRPAFMLWLLWNYRKQDYKTCELVIIDSSSEPLRSTDPDVIILRCPPGTNVASKRNLALAAARGTLITWFDDDDWQHPRKISILTAALGQEGILAGSKRSWFVDLYHHRARPYVARNVIFNGIAARTAALDHIRFNEAMTRSADTPWVAAVRRRAAHRTRVVPDVLSWWLCHAGNISNPAAHHAFPRPFADVRRAVGVADWGDTDHELTRLRDRLAN